MEKQKWAAEMKIREAELEERRAKLEEHDQKREAERELLSRRSSDLKFIPRMRCFECGAATRIQINCPQLLGKTTPKQEATVSRLSFSVVIVMLYRVWRTASEVTCIVTAVCK